MDSTVLSPLSLSGNQTSTWTIWEEDYQNQWGIYLDLVDKFWGAHLFCQKGEVNNIDFVFLVDSLLGITFVFYQNGDIINIDFVFLVDSSLLQNN